MGIKPEAQREWAKWLVHLQNANRGILITIFYIMSEAVKRGGDSISVAASFYEMPREERLGNVSDVDLFEVFWAFAIFHILGDSFRQRWNQVIGPGKEFGRYHAYIEEGSRKHLISPWCRPPKIDGFNIFPKDGSK